MEKKMNDGITNTDLYVTLNVLKKYKEVFDGWQAERADALAKAYDIIETELEYEIDQEIHSEFTIEQETGEVMGREIPLSEWARKNHVDPDNARQRATRGTLPAHKVGSIWMINEIVPNEDKRVKKKS